MRLSCSASLDACVVVGTFEVRVTRYADEVQVWSCGRGLCEAPPTVSVCSSRVRGREWRWASSLVAGARLMFSCCSVIHSCVSQLLNVHVTREHQINCVRMWFNLLTSAIICFVCLRLDTTWILYDSKNTCKRRLRLQTRETNGHSDGRWLYHWLADRFAIEYSTPAMALGSKVY